MKQDNFEDLLKQFDKHMVKWFEKQKRAKKLLAHIQTESKKRLERSNR